MFALLVGTPILLNDAIDAMAGRPSVRRKCNRHRRSLMTRVSLDAVEMLLGTRVQFPPPPLFLNMRLQATAGVKTRLNGDWRKGCVARGERSPPGDDSERRLASRGYRKRYRVTSMTLTWPSRGRLARAARDRPHRHRGHGQGRKVLKNSIWADSVQLAADRSLSSLAGSYVTPSSSTEVPHTQHEFERKLHDAVRSLPVASEPDRAKLKMARNLYRYLAR